MGIPAAAIPALQAAALATTAVSAGVQYNQGQKSAEAQEKTNAAQQQQQELQARRQRLRIIREQRIKAAQIESMGANTGSLQSSGVAGGIGSTQSQAGSNINNLDQQMGLAKNITGYQQDAAKANQVSSIFGTIGGVSNQVFSDYGGYKELFK